MEPSGSRTSVAETNPCLDNFRMREIEQKLTAELQSARDRVRSATTTEQKRSASESRDRALQRMTDFVARKIVPAEFV